MWSFVFRSEAVLLFHFEDCLILLVCVLHGAENWVQGLERARQVLYHWPIPLASQTYLKAKQTDRIIFYEPTVTSTVMSSPIVNYVEVVYIILSNILFRDKESFKNCPCTWNINNLVLSNSHLIFKLINTLILPLSFFVIFKFALRSYAWQ